MAKQVIPNDRVRSLQRVCCYWFNFITEIIANYVLCLFFCCFIENVKKIRESLEKKKLKHYLQIANSSVDYILHYKHTICTLDGYLFTPNKSNIQYSNTSNLCLHDTYNHTLVVILTDAIMVFVQLSMFS